MMLFRVALVLVLSSLQLTSCEPLAGQRPFKLAVLGDQDSVSFQFPHPHKPHPINKTVYEVIRDEEKFSRLFKLVNISEEIVEKLNETSSNLTFFALPDHAFPRHPPHRRRLEFLDKQTSMSPETIHAAWDNSPDILAEMSSYWDLVNDPDGSVAPPDRERRKKIVKKIVTAILSYHILPKELSTYSLRENTTYATSLSGVLGALHNEPFRIRVGRVLPLGLSVNLYAKIILPDIPCSNGVIHAINHPLLPPPTVFQQLFLFQKHFSYLSSAVQRVGLTDFLDYSYRSRKGSPVITMFAPTNDAFKRLPPKLQLFLFSPFGERALRKILALHTVPNVTFHSDWILNITSSSSSSDQVLPDRMVAYNHDVEGADLFEWSTTGDPLDLFVGNELPVEDSISTETSTERGVLPRPRPPKPDYVYRVTLPTALSNHTLNALVLKFAVKLPIPGHRHTGEFVTRILINGRPVAFNDGVSSNGALHVVDRLLSPRPAHHKQVENSFSKDEDWQDWQDWLPQWADED